MVRGHPDYLDKKLVAELQLRFPLTERPFEEVGRRLGLSEAEVLSRTREMIREGIVRRIGYMAGKSLQKMKSSTLVGMKVETDRADWAASVISNYREVTHNYLRDNELNLWFTVSASDRGRLEDVVREIVTKVRPLDWIELPSVKSFKLLTPSVGISEQGVSSLG